MPDSSFLSLIAVGGAALFGLHGAIGLAIKNYFLKITYLKLMCNGVSKSIETHTSNFILASSAAIFYSIVLFILIHGIFQNEIQILLLNALMILAMLATSYYAFKMFFRVRIICFGCIRVHLANLMMSSAILFYNFH